VQAQACTLFFASRFTIIPSSYNFSYDGPGNFSPAQLIRKVHGARGSAGVPAGILRPQMPAKAVIVRGAQRVFRGFLKPGQGRASLVPRALQNRRGFSR